MNDDFATLYSFDRWANSTMLDACRKLSPEQYVAEPAPGWPQKMLDRAYRNLGNLLPSLTPERLVTPQKFLCGRQVVVAVPWAVMRHVVNHATYHRGQVASKLKRFGIQQPDTDFIDWVIEQNAQKD
jgi:uncharacterized damage-inducible protein DinB